MVDPPVVRVVLTVAPSEAEDTAIESTVLAGTLIPDAEQD